ncbi:hybrid sensor histidine kinase/response regulator [Hymenobacter weizhouensis]|uniref:hybrid sensor histidine kinase/response regulator n=1 Tax=Hymenobacter sp. YIM 151500-1 TaxID=2987689 RepID=UPI00222638A0|nr:hybrid sensor histidine kinase/response regulator [Hymenobacter sp. YIM 151500-1]UYZ63049.1 ATP-binding protein [Hymenobacter sp. YIM 151500-1]
MTTRLLLLLLFLSRVVAAQPLPARQYLKQLGAAEGLPQPFIYALAQDRAGYLWVGTAEGLMRYDGTTFQPFTSREGLAEDFVTQLAVHPRTGQLWVGHYRGHVSVSQGRRFAAVEASKSTFLRPRPGLPAPDTARLGQFRRRYRPALPAGAVLTCLLRDTEGTYWVGTAGHGLWRLTDPHVTYFATAERLTALAGRGATLAAGTATGQLLHLESTPTSFRLNSWPQPAPAPITALLPSAKTPGWITLGTSTHGLQGRPPFKPSLSDEAGRWVVDTATVSRPLLPAALHVMALAEDSAGGLWVGTLADGAYYLPAQGPAIHYTTANGLLQNDVYAILPDRQGRVWFATHGTGLAVLEAGRFRVHQLAPGGVNATALAQDAAGRIWIGTEGEGVYCFVNGRFRQFTSLTTGLASNYCYGLVPTPAGLLVQHRHALSLGRGSVFAPLTTPNNPTVRDLLPNSAASITDSVVLLAARRGLVRVRLPARLPAASAPVVLTAAEVDGTRQPATLPNLPPQPHHVTWLFRVASLAPAGAWQYQYRLQGFQEEWSSPTTVPEADFPRLDAGRYVLEVRARRGAESRWSAPTAASFTIATPFWRTGWFAGMTVLLLAGLGYAATWARTAALQRQKLRLETTVNERTAELRQQKAEIEQINADLVVARDAAEASRRAKSQFLANMSHEIRTPMNAVIGLTYLLRNTPVDAEQREYLEAIHSSSHNLLVILNDILDFSKMEAGKLTLEHTAFRLSELVAGVVRLFQFAVDAKGLVLHATLAPDVPPVVFGDPVRLNQVLVNLVGNAVKFTSHGSITVRLDVVPGAGAGEPARLRWAVQDTGIGIAQAKLDAIFEDFSQANPSTTRQFGGTGLGLSIARNLVLLHGGQLWVESEEGRGSTFWFDIPCHPADEALVQAQTAATLAPFEPPLRVLVAEDNELNQLVVCKTLEAWNVRVTLAANGRLAVEAAQQHPFDAVLLDVQMPEMDGYEAARQLRALFPSSAQLPLIGLTASALPEDRALALEAGMDDTLAKPFDPAVLYARLAHFTGRPTASAKRPGLPPPPKPADPATTHAAPTVCPDWSLLEELAGGNESFVQQIVRTFLAQAPELLPQLLAAATPAERAATAHKLKGQVAYFGVAELTAQLEWVEQQAAVAGPAELAARLNDIAQLLHQLQPALHSRLPSPSLP